MLVEFTDGDNHSVLINSDKVSVVREEFGSTYACIILDGADIKVNVRQGIEEIKKRFGMVITPRAETIARI